MTDGDPPFTLFRQRGLRWLDAIDTFSVSLPGHPVLLFHRDETGFVDDRVPGETFRLVMDESRILKVRREPDAVFGLEDGLLVSIGPSVDILIRKQP